jgi:hypothetical protein
MYIKPVAFAVIQCNNNAGESLRSATEVGESSDEEGLDVPLKLLKVGGGGAKSFAVS